MCRFKPEPHGSTSQKTIFCIVITVKTSNLNNIKMDLREIGWGGMDRIDLSQDRDQWTTLVNTVMNLRVP
jgi:hypothetical protein